MFANLARRLLDSLAQPHFVTFQLLMSVHGAYIFRALKDGYYETLDRSLGAVGHIDREQLSLRKENRLESSSDPKEDGSDDGSTMKVYNLRMYSWYKLYSRISTGYIIYATARTTLSKPLEALISLYDPEKPHCYLPGVFVLPLHLPLSGTLGYIFALCHITWRLIQASLGRPLRLTMLFYMLQSESSIERHLRLFGHEHTDARLKNLCLEGRLTQLDLFLHKILYYTVRHKTKIVYKLRPNRSLESRRQIYYTVAKCTILCFCIVFILFWIFFLPIARDMFTSFGYTRRYPNCDPQVDRLASEGKLSMLSLVATSPYWILTFIFDFAENFILWIDSALAIYFNLPFAYQLNKDIIIYWRHLHDTLDRLSSKLELDHALKKFHPPTSELMIKNPYGNHRDDGDHNRVVQADTERKFEPIIVEAKRQSKYRGSIGSFSNGQYGSRSNDNRYQLYTECKTREAEILEIQAEVNDFFRQIEMVDTYVSDVISASIVIWLFSYAIITYISLVKVAGYVPIFLRLSEVCGFILFTISTMFLISLHRKTMSSYRCIVSLMALDQSEHKRRFLGILEFYTGKNRAAYTVFHRTPFLATTYLSIIGWSLSSLFIVENLFRER